MIASRQHGVLRQDLGLDHRFYPCRAVGAFGWESSQVSQSRIHTSLYSDTRHSVRRLGLFFWSALRLNCVTDIATIGSLIGRNVLSNTPWRSALLSLRALIAPWTKLRYRIKSNQQTRNGSYAAASGQPTASIAAKVGATEVICLVTYKLNPKRALPTSFLEELKKPGNGWAHDIDEVWVISTTETVAELYTRLSTHLNLQENGGDFLLVVEIADERIEGWMPKAFWKWRGEERTSGY